MTLYLIVRTNHVLPVPAKHNVLLGGNNLSRVTGEEDGTDIPESLIYDENHSIMQGGQSNSNRYKHGEEY